MRRLQYKKRRSVRNQKKRFQKSGRKTMRGGGDVTTSSFSLPISKFYPLNSYDNDPSVSPLHSSERLTPSMGGSKRRRRYKRKNQSKQMRGGSQNLTTLTMMPDSIIGGPYAQSLPNMFANVAGSGNLAYSLVGQSAPTGNTGGMISVVSNASTMA